MEKTIDVEVWLNAKLTLTREEAKEFMDAGTEYKRRGEIVKKIISEGRILFEGESFTSSSCAEDANEAFGLELELGGEYIFDSSAVSKGLADAIKK